MSAPTEPQVPTCFPPYLDAGTTFKVDRSFSDFDNVAWAYTLYFAGVQTLSVQATADPDGSTFHVVVTPAQTKSLNTGAVEAPYQYVERLSNATTGEAYDVGRGRIMVNADLSSVTAGATVSYEEQTLAIIEAALQGRLTSDMESYSIAGRSITKIPVRDLISLRGTYKALVWKQRNPGKLTQPVKVVFPTIDTGPFAWTTKEQGS